MADCCQHSRRAGPAFTGFSSALAYFDSLRTGQLWTNLVQAQRDYFGAHTYQRIDRPGAFHTEWQSPGEQAKSVPVEW